MRPVHISVYGPINSRTPSLQLMHVYEVDRLDDLLEIETRIVNVALDYMTVDLRREQS